MPTGEMTGKTVVVTGGNSGIGLQTAVGLARMGARVLITARDPDRGRAAVSSIQEQSGNDGVELVVFDLASLDSVRSGAQEIKERTEKLDVLINNAGIVLSDRQVTVDGFEATFGINHLGPFLLTELLLDHLKASAPARIVNVASTAHNQARRGLDFDDLQATKRYRGMSVYGASKLANILFTTELARRLAGTNVTANCLHPGTVATGYGRDGDTKGLLAIGLVIVKPFLMNPEQGARTSIYLASSPEVATVTGQYFIKCKVRTPSKAAQAAAAAQHLWEVSEQLVGASTN
jgi:retinol dehydrogenase-12